MLNKYSTICFAVLSVIALFASCTKTTEPMISYFVVKVDSLAIPDTISQSDTLKIKLYGTIGNNGNYSFDHYEATRDSFKLNLKVWGKYVDKGLAAMVIVMLDGVEYPVFPVYPNKFKIFIHQPDNSVLQDSVVVE